MKKIISLILMLGIVLSIPMGAMAADGTVLDFDFDFPSGMSVYTLDWAREHDDELYEEMKQENILMDAYDNYSDLSIWVSYMPYYNMDSKEMSDTDFEAFAYYMIKMLNEVPGCKAVAQGFYSHPQAEFAIIREGINSAYGTFFVWQYITLFEGLAVTVAATYNSHKGQMEPEHQQMLEDFIDSIDFHDTWRPKKRVEQIYNDPYTDIVLRLPENWEVKEYIEPRQLFESYGGMAGLTYGYADVYAELNFFDRLFWKRSEFDNSYLNSELVAQITGINAQDITTAEYGGREYYIAEGMYKDEETGEDLWLTKAIHVDNGYLHVFEFNDSSDSPYFKDLESMLENAMY